MAKKKSNTKSTLITIGILILVVASIFVIPPLYSWVLDNKEPILFGIAVVAAVGAIILWWWFNERQRKRAELFYKVVDSIKSLSYAPTFREERPYHTMLYGYLLGKGFDVQYEVMSGGSRPDLVVEGIAIEVKGPTDSIALQTLSHKVMKYSNHYKYLCIVLFDCICSKYTMDETLMGIARFIRGKIKMEVVVKRAT